MNQRWVPVYEAITVPYIEPLYGALNQSGCKKSNNQEIGKQQQCEWNDEEESKS